VNDKIVSRDTDIYKSISYFPDCLVLVLKSLSPRKKKKKIFQKFILLSY